jgi:hypothetical protein
MKRIAKMEAFKLHTLKAPCLFPIKQLELYKKFRPFVPHEYWGDTCPRPSGEVLAQVKDETAKYDDKESVTKSAPHKMGRWPQKKHAVIAPKVKNAKGMAVAAAAAKGDNDTESDYSKWLISF